MANDSKRIELLKPGPIRDQLHATHPVVQDRVRIATRAVEEVVDIASTAILHRRPGSYFTAEPRVGKTTAIEVMKAALPQRFPAVPILDLIAKSHTSFTEKNFFGEVLLDLQFASSTMGTAAERRLRCFNVLLSCCRTVGSDRLVLLIDEAQCWGESEFELLRDLANDLRRQGVVCITLIFGHPNIETIVKSNLLKKGRTDLTARFLMKRYPFSGAESMTDLQHIFSAFDSPNRHQYPPNTDLSFSEFFYPTAFENGWRLTKETSNAWSCFTSALSQRRGSTTKLGMNLIMGAIRHFFLSEVDPQFSARSTRNWNDAVAASMY